VVFFSHLPQSLAVCMAKWEQGWRILHNEAALLGINRLTRSRIVKWAGHVAQMV
jgi:hypothetical protein